MEDATPLTDIQIRDEVLTLCVTGFETVGDALAWTWYLLASHSEVEQAMFRELDELLDGSAPRPENLADLCYTQQVLSESLRLYPPTWIYIRVAAGSDRLPSGPLIPPKSKLYLCPYVVHRHPKYFSQPDRFDPDRFLPEAQKSRPRFAYFPFGGGPRKCIGESFAKMEAVLGGPSLGSRLNGLLSGRAGNAAFLFYPRDQAHTRPALAWPRSDAAAEEHAI